MASRRRRRRSTPTPAQIWRILHAIGRERRLARRESERERLRAERESERERQRAKRESERAKRESERAKREIDLTRREIAALEREIRELDKEQKEERAARERERTAWQKAQAERNVRVEKEIFRILGDGDNRWGMLIEALVEGNLLKILRDAGIGVDDATARRRSMRRGIWREYDLVAVGEREAVVVEVKTTLRMADVARFTERIRDFREWRSDDARERVWGALAYLAVEGNAARAAEKAGFYLIRAVSGSARLVNSEGFEPRSF